jgi:hypothetical protein
MKWNSQGRPKCLSPFWKTGSNSEKIHLGSCKRKKGHKGRCRAIVEGEVFEWDREKGHQ